MLMFSAVESIKDRKMATEMMVRTSISPDATALFASCAYSTEAMARIVEGNEYAHHTRSNFFMAFLNRAGLQACFIFHTFSTCMDKTRGGSRIQTLGDTQ